MTVPRDTAHELAEGLFEAACARFRSAVEAVGERQKSFAIADGRVALRFAGDALIAPVTAALVCHGPRSASEPDLEVCLWDAASTGVPAPAPPVGWDRLTARGEIHGLVDTRFRIAFRYGEYSLNLYDPAANRALFFVEDAAKLPAWFWAAPLRAVFHWWQESLGRQLVHAAAVADGEGAVLIAGRGGAGKSSTAMTCLLEGHELLGEDYVVVGLRPVPEVFSLYGSAKLVDAQLEGRDALDDTPRLRDTSFDKTVFFLGDRFGAQLPRRRRLDGILLAEVSGRSETTTTPCGSLEVDQAISPETLRHLPHAGASTVSTLTRLSHAVPVARLEIGTDRSALSAAVAQARRAMRSADPPAPDPEQSLPYLSIVVVVDGDEREVEPALAQIEAQRYPRVEVVVKT